MRKIYAIVEIPEIPDYTESMFRDVGAAQYAQDHVDMSRVVYAVDSLEDLSLYAEGRTLCADPSRAGFVEQRPTERVTAVSGIKTEFLPRQSKRFAPTKESTR